jgi:hypothetical protein
MACTAGRPLRSGHDPLHLRASPTAGLCALRLPSRPGDGHPRAGDAARHVTTGQSSGQVAIDSGRSRPPRRRRGGPGGRDEPRRRCRCSTLRVCFRAPATSRRRVWWAYGLLLAAPGLTAPARQLAALTAAPRPGRDAGRTVADPWVELTVRRLAQPGGGHRPPAQRVGRTRPGGTDRRAPAAVAGPAQPRRHGRRTVVDSSTMSAPAGTSWARGARTGPVGSSSPYSVGEAAQGGGRPLGGAGAALGGRAPRQPRSIDARCSAWPSSGRTTGR